MAIALDNNNTNVGNGNVSPVTFTHVMNGTDHTLLIAYANIVSPSSFSWNSVTYNGVAMTQLGTDKAYTGGQASLWYLLAPSSGSNTVSFDWSGSIGNTSVFRSISYTGVSQSSFPDASRSFSGSGTSTGNQSLSTVSDNCWEFIMLAMDPAVGGVSSWTNATTRGNSNKLGSADTNGAITPPQSYTISATLAGSTNFGGWQVSFAPPSQQTFRTLLGVGL